MLADDGPVRGRIGFALTRRAVHLALALAGLALVLPGTLVELNGAFALALALDYALARRPAQFRYERRLPPQVGLGQAVALEWRIGHDGGRSVTVGFADDLQPSLRAERRRSTVTVPAGGEATASTTLVPSRRGHFAFGGLTVRVYGPLGLAARQGRVAVPGALRVLPAFPSRSSAELRIQQGRRLETGLRRVRTIGAGTEFEQLREYGPDDDHRHIDWSATARAGKTIVRTFQTERNQAVVCLLDAGRVMAARVDGVPRLEHAMDAVMALTVVAVGLGDRAGLVTFGSRVRDLVAPDRRPDQVARVTDALYDLQADLAEADYRGAFTRTLASFPRRSLLVLLTDLADHTVVDTVLPALPLVTSHHLVIVAGVVDPGIADLARRRPDTAAEAHERAAAVDALRLRAQGAARLRAAGATVVDAAPGRLAVDLADAYLRLKGRGRL